MLIRLRPPAGHPMVQNNQRRWLRTIRPNLATTSTTNVKKQQFNYRFRRNQSSSVILYNAKMDQSKLWNKGLRMLSVVLGLTLICSIYSSITSNMDTEAMQEKYTEEEIFVRIIALNNELTTEIQEFELKWHDFNLLLKRFLPTLKKSVRDMLNLLETEGVCRFQLQDSSAIYDIADELKFKEMKNKLNECKEVMDSLGETLLEYPTYPRTFKALNEFDKDMIKILSTQHNLVRLASETLQLRLDSLSSVMNNQRTTDKLNSVLITVVIEVLIAFGLIRSPSKRITVGCSCGILALQSFLSLGIPILAWIAVIMMWMNQIEYEMLIDFWKMCTTQKLTKRERLFQKRKKHLEQCTESKKSEEHFEETKVPNKALSKEVKEFKCPVCMEVMEAPMQIYGCSNDHLICSNCVKCVNACPICRLSFRTQKPKRRFQCESLLSLILQKESLKIQDNEFFTQVERMYECPLCLNVMQAPTHIVGCSNDHWFCSDCMGSQFESCPICRKSFKKQKPKRRYKAESLFCTII